MYVLWTVGNGVRDSPRTMAAQVGSSAQRSVPTRRAHSLYNSDSLILEVPMRAFAFAFVLSLAATGACNNDSGTSHAHVGRLSWVSLAATNRLVKRVAPFGHEAGQSEVSPTHDNWAAAPGRVAVMTRQAWRDTPSARRRRHPIAPKCGRSRPKQRNPDREGGLSRLVRPLGLREFAHDEVV